MGCAGVTDDGAGALAAGAGALRRVNVWLSGVTSDGAAVLRERRVQVFGLDDDDDDADDNNGDDGDGGDTSDGDGGGEASATDNSDGQARTDSWLGSCDCG